jgi:inner membrane protein
VRNPFNSSSRSASAKAAIVAFLTLVLLIPMGMIEGVIVDRQNNASVASVDIRSSWGGDQTVTGPILRLPYSVNKQTVYGSAYTEEQVVHILAEELVVTADVTTEIRYRGIHEVPMFRADIEITGKIDLGALATLGIAAEQVTWSGAEIFLGISDPKAISKIPVIVANGSGVNFTSSGDGIEGLASQLSASVGRKLTTPESESRLAFDISVAVNGSGSLQFLPLAENASVTMSANWASPSFTGRQLPTGRDLREDGFDAAWHATSLGRKLPAVWIDSHAAQVSVAADAFGTRFIQPVGLYQLIERATKYAVLFIGLTFVTYFLIEIVGNLRLHPLQYLLVGLANTLFYLLLLSLSEHVGFDIAYLVSALASAALISGYSAAILVRRARALAMAAVLTGLYAFLYLTLNAESFALLAGSIGLWIVLAVVMYLTRGINWYAAAEVDQRQMTAD